MGRPKLLLTLGDETVIRRLLSVLNQPLIQDRVVVARSSDTALAAEVSACDATLIQPDVDPPDMRDSVTIALSRIEEQHSPEPEDGWLLVPADHPVLDGNVIEQLLSRWTQSDADILVPTFGGRRGHPTIFSWRLAGQLASIPDGFGLNWLLKEFCDAVEEVPLESETVLLDLDTPEDYAALQTAMAARTDAANS